MNVLISGSSGLIGSALVQELGQHGDDVFRLLHGKRQPEQPFWNLDANAIDLSFVDRIDAVIHLAGEGIGSARWTARKKQRILESRVRGTRLLSETLAGLASLPKVLISASGSGIYGDRGDRLVDESCEAGTGFLPDVAQQWEAATRPAAEAGIRVVLLRFGIVLSRAGGALQRMLLPFKLGLGGIIGTGRQYMSWVCIDDVVAATHHILVNESLDGPVKLTTPYPVTNAELTKILGHVLHRPTIAWMPACAARLVLGEMADEILLVSTRAVPRKLTAAGYKFRYPTLEGALTHLFSR